MARDIAPRLTAEDKKWRAKNDLDTLRAAGAIQSDKQRLNAAKRMASEEVKNLRRIAGRGPRK